MRAELPITKGETTFDVEETRAADTKGGRRRSGSEQLSKTPGAGGMTYLSLSAVRQASGSGGASARASASVMASGTTAAARHHHCKLPVAAESGGGREVQAPDLHALSLWRARPRRDELRVTGTLV